MDALFTAVATSGCDSDDPVELIRNRVGKDRRIAFVAGNFNIVHPGHLRLLRFAADNSDVVIVGVHPDTAPNISVPAELRLDSVRSISLVTHAFLMQEPVEAIIVKLRPDIVVKGREFESQFNPEQAVVASYGGKLLFSSGEVRFSSLGLLQREYFHTEYSTIAKPLDYPQRHGFKIAELKDTLAACSGMNVLVIGDLIVDTYITCEALGMSQEDPTIVVTPIEEKTFLGGAGIVAAHARGLGANVRLLSVGGPDKQAAFAREQLDAYDIDAKLFVDPSRPTTHKQRFRALGKTLLRVNNLRQHAIDMELIGRMMDCAEDWMPTTDLILFADFNYGCLPTNLVEAVIEMTPKRVMMAADSQASSQISDITRFPGMTLVTPTEREARLALHDFNSGIAVVAERLKDRARATNVVITLGSEGLLAYAPKGGTYVLDRLPAFNSVPKDVAGAGDSLFACTAIAICAGFDIWRSIYLGSIAAACQVGRVGNTPLTFGDLVIEIDGSN